MNFLPIAIGGAIIATIALGSVIKKWRSERKKKETTAVVASVIAGAGTKKDEGKKLTLMQQVKRWWLIIIIVIPATWWVGKAIWTPTFSSVKSSFGIKVASPTAFYSWKKKPNQYGYNPAVRCGGPYKVIVTKNDDKVLNFQSSTASGVCYFYGSKTDGKIKGKWLCNGVSGGNWELKRDTSTSTEERYTGIESDPCIPEGKPSELLILK